MNTKQLMLIVARKLRLERLQRMAKQMDPNILLE